MKQTCKYAKLCGGCQYQDLSYPKQLERKQKQVERLLQKYGEVNPILKSEIVYHYRNKNQMSFSYDRAGHVHMGNYRESTHYIVDVEDCQINSVLANHIFQVIKELIITLNIHIFNEDTLKGFLRHVLVRTSADDKHALVVLVTGEIKAKHKEHFVEELCKQVPEIDTVVQNINHNFTSMVLGKKTIVLEGDGYLKDTLLGNTFCISASSFYQINHTQTEKIYQHAIALAEFQGTETVLDAYCGIGTIGISLAKYVKEVDAVEINTEAIKDAKRNAALNKITNIHFVAQDAKDFIKAKVKEKRVYDVVVVDPPRMGLDSAFLFHLLKLSPHKVIYISCNPETQARDIQMMRKKGYKVKHIQPFDMLPFTQHIETVCLLSNNNARTKDYVEIGMDAEDYYRIKDSE